MIASVIDLDDLFSFFFILRQWTRSISAGMDD